MHWFADYWWVILILLIGIIINAIKDMNKIDPKQFLKSGCYTAMAMYPLTEKGEQLLRSSLSAFVLQYQQIELQTRRY